MVDQADFGGVKSSNHKDIEEEVRAVFDQTIKKTKQELEQNSVTPMLADTTESKSAISIAQTTAPAKSSLQKTSNVPAWEQSQKQLNNKGIIPTTNDFSSTNSTPTLQGHSLRMPVKQEVEPITQSFVDVHKSASPNSSTNDSNQRGDSTRSRDGGFEVNRSNGQTKRSGSFKGLQKTYGDHLSAPDFTHYSNIGANIENPSYTEAEGYANIFGWRPGAEQIENIVTFSRDNADLILMNELNTNSVVGDFRYSLMTDDEVSIYNYLLAKEGQVSAQKYLDYLEEELNRRIGTTTGEAIRSTDNAVARTLMTGANAVGAGLDQFQRGVQQIFSEEQVPASSTHFSSQYIRDDLIRDDNELGVIAYDVTAGLSNMAPSILVSSLLTPATGAAVQGISSAGNAYGNALDNGYNKEQAQTYATLIGISEGALQYALGGIKKLGGLSSESLMTKVAGIDNGLLRAAAALGVKGLSEVSEEELQLALEPLYRSIVFGEEYNAPTVEEFVYTAILSLATTSVLEGGDIASYMSNDSTRSSAGDVTRRRIGDAPLETIDPSELEGWDAWTLFFSDENTATDNVASHADPVAENQAVGRSTLASQSPLTVQERRAMLGEAILDMGGMPKADQLEAMGMDEATARGIQSLVLLSKENDPTARRAVEAMIDLTDPEIQIDLKQDADADSVPVELQDLATISTGEHTNVVSFKSWEEMREIYKDSINQFVKDNKPRYSPDIKKWFANGGTIAIQETKGQQTWTYTSAAGDSVPYIDGYVRFPEKYLNQTVPSVNIGHFSANRRKDIDIAIAILTEEYGLAEIPTGYVIHHDVEDGSLQLVDERIHRQFTHIGGYSMCQ